AQLSHETTPDLARLAWTTLMLLGAARLAQPGAPQAWRGLLWWLIGLLGLMLSHASALAGLLGLGWLALIGWQRHRGATEGTDATHVAAWGAALAAWLLAMGLSAWLGDLQAPDVKTAWAALPWDSWARLLLWFTWPAWPLVLWTL